MIHREKLIAPFVQASSISAHSNLMDSGKLPTVDLMCLGNHTYVNVMLHSQLSRPIDIVSRGSPCYNSKSSDVHWGEMSISFNPRFILKFCAEFLDFPVTNNSK